MPKKGSNDGKPQFRVCTDPRHLNAKLKEDRHPLCSLRELIDHVSGAKVFSSLDLAASYHQLRIAEEDQQKTAFTWKQAQFCFQGAPFGIKTLPAIFQRIMAQLFFNCDFAIVYLDDLLIFSLTIVDHKEHLKVAMQKLTDVNLTLNLKKCNLIC